MAIATDLAVGTVLLNGDLVSNDATSPELTNTGVNPGGYSACGLFVDQKGRVLFAKSYNPGDLQCASVSDCGGVIVGQEIDVDVDSIISINEATSLDAGVVKVGNGFAIDGCVLSVDFGIASSTNLGLVQIPLNQEITIDGTGFIDVKLADNVGTKGVLSVNEKKGLTIASGELTFNSPSATSALGLVAIQSGSAIDLDVGGDIDLIPASTSEFGIVRPSGDLSVSSGTLSLALPIATSSTTGKAKPSSTVSIDSGTGVMDVVINPATTSPATTSTKGVVHVGSGFAITGGGLLSVVLDDATTSTKGSVQIGDNINVSSGIISVADADGSTKGVVIGGDGVDVTAGVVTLVPATNTTFGGIKVKPGTFNFLIAPAGEINLIASLPLSNQINTYTRIQSFVPTEVNSGSSYVPNLAGGNVVVITLDNNTAIQNGTNGVNGGIYTFIIKQDATGGRTLAFGSNYNFESAPTVTSTANAIDVITVHRLSSTNYICQYENDFK
jgi:hypothetical protein